jgi:hypothetical protein
MDSKVRLVSFLVYHDDGCNIMNGNMFQGRVFSVREPPCTRCHLHNMEFSFHEKSDASEMDWLQWSCTDISCGHAISVQIL